jgi:hypothetical protein
LAGGAGSPSADWKQDSDKDDLATDDQPAAPTPRGQKKSTPKPEKEENMQMKAEREEKERQRREELKMWKMNQIKEKKEKGELGVRFQLVERDPANSVNSPEASPSSEPQLRHQQLSPSVPHIVVTNNKQDQVSPSPIPASPSPVSSPNQKRPSSASMSPKTSASQRQLSSSGEGREILEEIKDEISEERIQREQEDYEDMLNNLREILNMKEGNENEASSAEEEEPEKEPPTTDRASEGGRGKKEEAVSPLAYNPQPEKRVKTGIPGVRGALIPALREMEVLGPEEPPSKRDLSTAPPRSRADPAPVPVDTVASPASTRKSSIDRFVHLGETLVLPNVSEKDPLSYRIESLRLHLEKELGEENFIKSYRILSDITDDDEDLNNKLHQILGEKLKFIPLIHQLIYCEELEYSKTHSTFN